MSSHSDYRGTGTNCLPQPLALTRAASVPQPEHVVPMGSDPNSQPIARPALSSPAALLVNVMTRSLEGGTCDLSSQATLAATTRVLPAKVRGRGVMDFEAVKH